METKKYNQFIYENLSKRELTLIKYAPYIILNRLISKILKSEPLLSLKYRDMKKTTQGKGENLISSIAKHPFKIENELKRINIKDLPESKVKKGLYPLFNKWKIYYNGEIRDPSLPFPRVLYPTDKSKGTGMVPKFFITKDNLSVGDIVVGYRGSWNSKSNEVIILCAKVDIDFSVDQASEDIKDIFTEICDNYPLEIKEFHLSISKENIHFYLSTSNNDVRISEELISDIMVAKDRSMKILENSEGQWDWSISYKTFGDTFISLKKEHPEIGLHLQKFGIGFSKKSQLSFN